MVLFTATAPSFALVALTGSSSTVNSNGKSKIYPFRKTIPLPQHIIYAIIIVFNMQDAGAYVMKKNTAKLSVQEGQSKK